MTEGQTMKRPKDKPSKTHTMIYKTLHRKLMIYKGFQIHTQLCSSTIDNSQWENCISLDLDFKDLHEPRNPRNPQK